MIYPAFKHDEPPRLPLLENGLSVKLTPRQEEVLQCLATGMPNKSIAFHLKMSESTVKAHIKEIMQRRSEEHTSELQSLMRISYAVFCLKKKQQKHKTYEKS